MEVRKRLFAILMSLTMVLTYMPAIAFANVDADADSNQQVSDEQQMDPDTGVDAVSDEEESAGEAVINVEPNVATEAVAAEAADDLTSASGKGADEASDKSDVNANASENIDADKIAGTGAATDATSADSHKTDEDKNGSKVAGKISVTGSLEPIQAKADVKIGDNEQLLNQFIDEKVAEEIAAKDKSRKYSHSRKTRLRGTELAIYKALVPQIADVAEGNSSNTAFTIPMNSIFDQLSFTADELWVDNILEDTGETDEDGEPIFVISGEAKERFAEEFEYNLEAVMNALLTDYPYELYWFDKTQLTESELPLVGASVQDESVCLCFEDDSVLTLTFCVSADYSANAELGSRGDAGTTSTNTDLTKRAASAAQNIAGIVTANKDRDDADKLVAYKDAVCTATDYNYEAAETANMPYGNPWQLIFVFDNDSDTNVVCEGYSKAFQYLCDNTIFDHAKIDCYTVSGTMDGGLGEGAHMWNILHMEDGRNYIADITNCDDGSIGAPDMLFLKGFSSGNMNNGYTYDCDGMAIKYVYDEDTLNQYSGAQLKMSAADYGSREEEEPQQEDGYEFVKDQTIVVGGDVWVEPNGTVSYTDNGEIKEGTYEVTDVTIQSQESDTGESVLDDPYYDPEGEAWRIRGLRLGEAVVKVEYQKLDGTAASYTFHVTVTDEKYYLYLGRTDEWDSDVVLPGGTIHLEAEGSCVHNDYYEGSEIYDKDMFRWELVGESEKYADISPDNEGIGAVITVREKNELADLLGTDEINTELTVRCSLVTGYTVLADKELKFNIVDEYLKLEPEEIEGIYRYLPEKISVSINRYSSGAADPEPLSDVTYEWDAPDDLRIEQGATTDGVTEFTITRLNEGFITATLRATYGEGETIERKYEFDDELYFYLREPDNNTLYSDGDATLRLEIPNVLKDKADGYKLVVKADEFSSEIAGSGVSFEIKDDEEDAYAEIRIDKSVLEQVGDSMTVAAEIVPTTGEYAGETAYRQVLDVQVSAPGLDFYDLPSDNSKHLTGSWISLYRSGTAWYRSADGEYEREYTITSAAITDGEECGAIKYLANEDAWRIATTKQGDIQVTISGYYDGNEEDTFTKTITLHIRNNIYDVWINDLNNTGRYVPGGIAELSAEINQNFATDELIGSPTCEWSLADGEDRAEFIDEEGNVITDPHSSNVRVRIKNNIVVYDEDASINVHVTLKEDDQKVAESETTLYVTSSYTRVFIEGLESDNLPIGEEKTFPLVAKRYSSSNPDGEVLDPVKDNLRYSIAEYYYEEYAGSADISIDGNMLTIKRKTRDSFYIYVDLIHRTGYGYGSIHVNSIYYPSIYFNDYDVLLLDNEDKTLSVDVSEYEDKYGEAWRDQFDIRWKIAKGYDEDGNWIISEELSDTISSGETPTEVVLNGSSIAEILGDQEDRSFALIAEVWRLDGGEPADESPVASTTTYVELKSASADYTYRLSDTEMTLTEDRWINAATPAWVVNAENPYGNEVEFTVLNVESDLASQTPDEDGKKVIEIEKYGEEEDSQWVIRALNSGRATVTVSYLDINGNYKDTVTNTPYTLTFEIIVKDDIYSAYIDCDPNVTRGITGDVIHLFGEVRHYGAETEEETFTYEWSILEEGDSYATIDADGSNATLTFGDYPDGGHGEYPFTVEMKVCNENGEEVATETREFVLSDETYVIVCDDSDTLMNIGKYDTVEVGFSILHKVMGREDERASGVVSFDESMSMDIEPVYGEQNVFRFTRLDSEEIYLYASADITDIFGENYYAREQFVIPAVHEHQLVHIDRTEATCTSEGNKEYWKCTECGRLFLDEGATKSAQPEDVVIAKTAHTPGEAVKEIVKEASCSEEGSYDEITYCEVCGEKLNAVTKIQEKKPHNLELVEAREAEDGEPGNKEHYRCTECGKLFLDAVGELETTEENVTIPADGTPRRATDVTEASDGNVLVYREGQYIYLPKATILERINEIRLEACTAGDVPDPRNPSKMLTPADYKEIKWSSDLEWIAQIRAAESTVNKGHTRTNNTPCYTLKHNGIQTFGEVLAYNATADIIGGINQWYGEKALYLEIKDPDTNDTGHYCQMIDPDNVYIGIGAFLSTQKGVTGVVAGEFNKYMSSADESQLPEISGTILQTVEVTQESLTITAGDATKVHIGSSNTLTLTAIAKYPRITADVKLKGNAIWSSADESIAKVDKTGNLTALKAGTTVVTAEYDGQGYPVEVTVEEHKWDEGKVTTEPTCHSEGVKTYTCTECDKTRTETISALAHKLIHQDAVEPTYTKEGHTEYWKCELCGDLFADENGENPVTEEDIVIPVKDSEAEKEKIDGLVADAESTANEAVEKAAVSEEAVKALEEAVATAEQAANTAAETLKSSDIESAKKAKEDADEKNILADGAIAAAKEAKEAADKAAAAAKEEIEAAKAEELDDNFVEDASGRVGDAESKASDAADAVTQAEESRKTAEGKLETVDETNKESEKTLTENIANAETAAKDAAEAKEAADKAAKEAEEAEAGTQDAVDKAAVAKTAADDALAKAEVANEAAVKAYGADSEEAKAAGNAVNAAKEAADKAEIAKQAATEKKEAVDAAKAAADAANKAKEAADRAAKEAEEAETGTQDAVDKAEAAKTAADDALAKAEAAKEAAEKAYGADSKEAKAAGNAVNAAMEAANDAADKAEAAKTAAEEKAKEEAEKKAIDEAVKAARVAAEKAEAASEVASVATDAAKAYEEAANKAAEAADKAAETLDENDIAEAKKLADEAAAAKKNADDALAKAEAAKAEADKAIEDAQKVVKAASDAGIESAELTSASETVSTASSTAGDAARAIDGANESKSAADTKSAAAVEKTSATENKVAEEKAKAEAEKKAAEEKAREEAEKKAAEEKAREEAEKRAAEEATRTGEDGTPVGKGASIQAAEKAITGMKSDSDPKGTVFNALTLRSSKVTNTAITLNWKKVPGAAKYYIYGNKCGSANRMMKQKELTGASLKLTKVVGNNNKAGKIKKGTYYKFVAVAVDKNGKVLSTSKVIHVSTKGGKTGNFKSVTTKAKKNKVTLKKGKKFKLNAKGVAQSKALKVKTHRKIAYETSNKKVATVTSKGVIKGVKKGTCYIYAYSQSGTFAKIKVTVK